MKNVQFDQLNASIKGAIYTDRVHRIMYATDASVYRELPIGVVYPYDEDDLQTIVSFCSKNKVPIIPRAGGTSLAGQCVGNGLVVDVSMHMNKLITVDASRKIAVVQPGIIRDELNHHLKAYGLMVGPNTSTANRATIGGMVGNNSCGSTSIAFGNTRDHVHKIKAVLSDGSVVEFGALSKSQFESKMVLQSLEGDVYRWVSKHLLDEANIEEIKQQYPDPKVRRRNTGYALDLIIPDEGLREAIGQGALYVDMCKLLCGSEGTLAIASEVTIGLVDIPPPHEALVAAHFDTVAECMEAVPSIMMTRPFACELMDKTILDCTDGQIQYRQDRYFIEGDPQAVLLISYVHESREGAFALAGHLIEKLRSEKRGYAHPMITEDIGRIWNLRSAGLGLLSNLPGDKKAVACIEDTAVSIDVLAAYISEFTEMMASFGQRSVYYAHAGDGEIHLRPILDLKRADDRKLFFEISQATARLVKKYRGSLSGEHGDGRVRSPFIKEVYGAKIYDLFLSLKSTWDPSHIMNPGKIVEGLPMNEYLRFDEDHVENTYETVFDFTEVGGILRAAEKCNGSGDCRKLTLSGGTMCPSYMATRNEQHTTRARANVLREILTRPLNDNPWNSSDLKEVMDLCLSCKGCTSECPSNIDMSTMKAEFQYHYNKTNGIPLRSKIFANFDKLARIASTFGSISNYVLKSKSINPWINKVMGIHPLRSLPPIARKPLKARLPHLFSEYQGIPKHKVIYLFVDEFSNYNDAEIGEKAVRLLLKLGVDVRYIDHQESGRAAISKGILEKARKHANANVTTFSTVVTTDCPLVGIEPSAILTFRDEYPKLVDKHLVSQANSLSNNCLTIEEYLYDLSVEGIMDSKRFEDATQSILLHGHCHQKALTDIKKVAWILSVPSGNTVSIIPSGCCGMAGSFGYETEHYDISMQIGELVLFPTIRNDDGKSTIVASGTSCRHQILDGAAVYAKHPIELLHDSLK